MIQSRARRKLASQEGFALVEVMISAAVLVILVLGTLAAVDAVTGTAGANKARTIAATLAERDQEDLRGLRTVELDKLDALIPAPRTVTVGKVVYTVTSDAQWVTDVGGSDISCALASGAGSYLRITSTVTSPMTGKKVKPVVISSIVAPQPGSGQLAARVTDAKGLPVQNLPVQAIGPTSSTKSTNAAGCAVFGSVDSGAYQIKLDSAGWVDPEGNQAVIQDTTVEGGSLTLVELVYDQAATLNVNLQTKVLAAVPQADDSYGIMAVQTGMQTGSRLFPENGVPPTVPATPSASYQLTHLFPFPEAYKIYSGRCAEADPFAYVPTYFDTNPMAAPVLVKGTTTTINILEPNINLTMKRSSAVRPTANVYATSQDADCPGEIFMGVTNALGQVPKPGLPFGNYDVCAEYLNGSGVWFHGNTTVANNAAAGATAKDLVIANSPGSGNGRC
jgi:Tfp pilus assembly protein PilV